MCLFLELLHEHQRNANLSGSCVSFLFGRLLERNFVCVLFSEFEERSDKRFNKGFYWGQLG